MIGAQVPVHEQKREASVLTLPSAGERSSHTSSAHHRGYVAVTQAKSPPLPQEALTRIPGGQERAGCRCVLTLFTRPSRASTMGQGQELGGLQVCPRAAALIKCLS